MNIAFMGTPDFAVPSLKKIIEKYGVKLVVTQPDKAKGRGKKVSISPVKEVAVENNIDVIQPVKIRNDVEAIEKLKSLDLDFIIVVAFGQILSKEILDIPRYGCINLHGSLLPKYRGAAPIQWAVINGEKVSGNTTMFMDVGVDTGDMLLKDEVEISDDCTAGELFDILKDRGADLLIETIDKVSKNEIERKKQDDKLSTHASMLNKEMAHIDWNKSSKQIHDLIRGMNPWPIAYTDYNGDKMKVFKSSFNGDKCTQEPGTILKADKKGIYVATGDGTLIIEKLQLPNGKPLEVSQFLNGHDIERGTILK